MPKERSLAGQWRRRAAASGSLLALALLIPIGVAGLVQFGGGIGAIPAGLSSLIGGPSAEATGGGSASADAAGAALAAATVGLATVPTAPAPPSAPGASTGGDGAPAAGSPGGGGGGGQGGTPGGGGPDGGGGGGNGGGGGGGGDDGDTTPPEPTCTSVLQCPGETLSDGVTDVIESLPPVNESPVGPPLKETIDGVGKGVDGLAGGD